MKTIPVGASAGSLTSPPPAFSETSPPGAAAGPEPAHDDHLWWRPPHSHCHRATGSGSLRGPLSSASRSRSWPGRLRTATSVLRTASVKRRKHTAKASSRGRRHGPCHSVPGAETAKLTPSQRVARPRWPDPRDGRPMFSASVPPFPGSCLPGDAVPDPQGHCPYFFALWPQQQDPGDCQGEVRDAPEALTGRRLVALSLHSGAEPTPRATCLHSFSVPKGVISHGPLVPGPQWAQQEPHWPGPYGVHSLVGQADVKCMSTLRSRSDECRGGDTGVHGSPEQGRPASGRVGVEPTPTAATCRGTCPGSVASPPSPSIYLIPRSPGGAPWVPLSQRAQPRPLTSAADRRQKLGAGHCVSPSAPGSGPMGSPGFQGGHCKAPVTSYFLLSVLSNATSKNYNGQTSVASRNPLTWANVEKPTANTRQY